jgi:hypothetical protein
MGECQEWELYLKNIFVSITRNATALEGDENVRELLKRCNEFYVSLFAKDDGKLQVINQLLVVLIHLD